MGRFIFFVFLGFALLAGAFAYFEPSKKFPDPVKFVMESSSFSSKEEINNKNSQRLNAYTNKGLFQLHNRMDDVAREQNQFLNELQDQQESLRDTRKGDVSDILKDAEHNDSGQETKDMIEDERREAIDQNTLIKERIADQEQQLKDMQNK